MTIETTIEWPFQVDGETEMIETPITVEYNYTRASHGRRDSYGQPLEPDEPPSVEIISVTMPSPGPVDRNAVEDIHDELTEAQKDRLEILCFEDVAERYEQQERERGEI